jgi:phosphate transport system substrate-binding protein
LTAGWLIAGCSRARQATRLIGSTSILPFAEMLAEEFNALNPDMHVEVQGGGSAAGLQAVADGIAEIGMCSRGLKSQELEQYEPIVIAFDGLSVVVYPGNPVSDLSLEQIRGIFTGQITNWSQLGGGDGPIHVITREEGSGTREAFQKMVMGEARISRRAVTQESNGAVKELVRNDPASIGYMSMGLAGELKNLSIAHARPTRQNVLPDSKGQRKYSLVRPFLFVTRKGAPMPTGAKRFVDFVLSPRGGAMLEKEGLVAPRETGQSH